MSYKHKSTLRVDSKRDLVRQGHVTPNVTFLISGSNDAKAMIVFFVLQVFWVVDV